MVYKKTIGSFLLSMLLNMNKLLLLQVIRFSMVNQRSFVSKNTLDCIRLGQHWTGFGFVSVKYQQNKYF
ncbi:MAG: hypothetical protein ACI8R9_000864 [Paraglaciecola sp.]|jgi:hypothetical protein